MAALSYVRAYRDPLGFLTKTARDFPDIAFLQLGRRRDCIVSHPDYVRDVLVTSEEHLLRGFNPLLRQAMGNGLLSSQGDFHRENRRRLLPLFDRKQIAVFSDKIVRHTILVSRSWNHGETRNIAADMLKLSFDVIVDILFGTRGKDARDLGKIVDRIIRLTGRKGYMRKFLISKLGVLQESEPRQTIRRLDELIYGWMDGRDSGTENSTDLLCSLLQTYDVDEPSGRRQVRDEAVTLLFAGHETTATALAWTWYLLSQHPQEERKLHDELDQVLGGRSPSIEDVPRLVFTEAVFREAMRLYPPVWLIVRRPIRDWPLKDFTIPAASYIYVSPFTIQRDPRFFAKPTEFRPGRWLSSEDAETRQHKFSYIPFGAAGRKCIGESFAVVEGVLMLAEIANHWKMRLTPGRSVVPEPLVTLRPKNGISVTLESR
jgi:cytochrome P450